MQYDGSNSARARSARIRSSHDHEATELDTMRRHTAACALQERSSFRSRVTSLVGRGRGHNVPALEPAAEGEILGSVNVNE